MSIETTEEGNLDGLYYGLGFNIKGTFCDKLTEKVIKSHLRRCKTCKFIIVRIYAQMKLSTPESIEKTERLRKGKIEQGHLAALDIVRMIYKNCIPEDMSTDPIYGHLANCEEGCPEMFMRIVKEAQRLEAYFELDPALRISEEVNWWRMTRS